MASVDGKPNSSYHVRALYSFCPVGAFNSSFHEGGMPFSLETGTKAGSTENTGNTYDHP
ncbi:hypothetical protein CEXT_752551, partial [Caerostris extrusa]